MGKRKAGHIHRQVYRATYKIRKKNKHVIAAAS